MSNKKATPDTFAQVVKQYLEIYVEDIQEDVEETANFIGKQAKEELKTKSANMFKKHGRSNPYYQGWTVKKDKKNKTYYTIKIWNKTNYQLTHLLEFGHATRNGKRTKAFPHIRPVEEKYSKQFEKDLEKKIRRTK